MSRRPLVSVKFYDFLSIKHQGRLNEDNDYILSVSNRYIAAFCKILSAREVFRQDFFFIKTGRTMLKTCLYSLAETIYLLKHEHS